MLITLLSSSPLPKINDFHLGNVENTLVLSQLNDEILQRCDKEVIDDSLLDVPVDVMVEDVASDFIPNSVMAIPL